MQRTGCLPDQIYHSLSTHAFTLAHAHSLIHRHSSLALDPLTVQAQHAEQGQQQALPSHPPRAPVIMGGRRVGVGYEPSPYDPFAQGPPVPRQRPASAATPPTTTTAAASSDSWRPHTKGGAGAADVQGSGSELAAAFQHVSGALHALRLDAPGGAPPSTSAGSYTGVFVLMCVLCCAMHLPRFMHRC